MVAGGGGSNVNYFDVYPHAGGLFTRTLDVKCSTQKNGYLFGIGQSLERTAGGGGYYGGAASAGRASGGSSYISGHLGCDSIDKNSTKDDIRHTWSMIHYSGKYFLYTQMEDGYSYMPTFDGTSEMVGNSENGYAKITRMTVENYQ